MRGTFEAHEPLADVCAPTPSAEPGKHTRSEVLPAHAPAATGQVGRVTAPVVQARAAVDDPAVFGPFDHLDATRPAAGLVAAGQELTAGDASAPATRAPAETGSLAAAGVVDATARLPHHDTIQAAFGPHDLGGVRVAQDGAAREATTALGAEAYTFGDRIALPRAELWTEAHEAAHTVQQRAGRVASHGAVGDAHERAADAVADRVVAGRSAVDLLDQLAPSSAGGALDPFAQLFTIKEAKLTAHWAYEPTKLEDQGKVSAERLTADQAFIALGNALKAYEAGATVATTEAVLTTATTFRSAYTAVPAKEQGKVKQTSAQLGKLIDEAHEELQVQLAKVAKDPNGLGTPTQKVDTAVGQLAGGPEQKGEHKRILRHQQQLGMKATRAGTINADDGPAIIQSWRARGDMYHVGAVLNLFPQLKVILYDLEDFKEIHGESDFGKELELADRWQQASMIADYYNQPNRVLYTTASGVAALGSKGAAYDLKPALDKKDDETLRTLFIDVGGCTTIIGLDLLEARDQGKYKERKKELAAAVAPAPTDNSRADAAEIKHYLGNHGWDTGAKYVLINFRDSGHAFIQKKIAGAKESEREGVIKGYNPASDQVGGNHPDLDTGVVGVKQLAKLVEDRGFTPVFMGEEPADAHEPHLIKYWTFKHTYGEPPEEKGLCRGGRAAEAYFVRVIAETYDVRLLSMRSGVTDQLAFLGIPTISIDIDNFHQAPVPELSKTPGYQLGSDEVAHSWARGSKLEAGLGRDYGRAFLSEQRKLGDFDQKGKWKGEFGKGDLDTLGSALDFYFGSADEPASEEQGIRHESHPFHPGKMAETAKGGAKVEATLKEGATGKIDTGLNPEVVLEHIRAVLGREDSSGVKEAVAFADSHLRFIEDGSSEVSAKDVEHRTRKLGERKAFLSQVIALLEEHGAAGKYQDQLETLEQLGALNGPRGGKLGKAVTTMKQAVAIPGIDHKDKRTAAYFQVIDGVDLDALAEEVAAAKAACTVELPAVHTARLDKLSRGVKKAHATLTSTVEQAVGALQDGGKDKYYRVRFVAAGETLAKVVLV